ncbi:hypothetical protein WH367_22745 [Comamonas sp. MYb21]|uniref:hypothetical protein n=1 Tax=Comamonas sp. MYb21 TaxID=1848648 RepID=UPI0030AED42A
MYASQVREELLKAEHVLDTGFSFDMAEPFYRRCLGLIEAAPNDQQEIERLVIEMFRTKQVSSEPLAYLMHVLRWEGVRDALEADLQNQVAPLATGVEQTKILAAFEPDWENRLFYRFS